MVMSAFLILITNQFQFCLVFFKIGIWDPKIGSPSRELPNVRIVRSILVTDENHPVVDMTHMVMQWGQFVDHDLTHVPVFRTGISSRISPSQLINIIEIY